MSLFRSSSLQARRTGAILPTFLFQLLVALLGAGVVGAGFTWFRMPGAPVALDAAATVTDTVVVYGPRRFDASTSGTVSLERLSFPRVAGRRYLVRVENGAADGSGRVSQGSVQLDGWQLIAGTELTAGVATLERPGAFRGSDTTVVSLTGNTGSYVSLSVLSVADPSVPVFGPAQYTIIQGTAKDHDTTFTAPAGSGPWTLTLFNGDSLGNHRTASATLTINGVSILTPNNFNQNVSALTTPVTLAASNAFHLRLPGEPEGFVIVQITGTDNTPPVLTVATPADNFLTRDTTITVTGTVQDQTQVTVTVNGVVAALDGSGNWSATVPLPVEGANTLAIRAQDATGLHTDSTRVVKRDTHAPMLTVSAPAADGFVHDTAATVSGTVTDASSFTLNLNGTPVAVDSLGHFSTSAALTEGVNILAVTATDAVGNVATVVRTLRRDTQPPVLVVSTPSTTVYSADSAFTVSGSALDANAVSVTVNGVPVALDSAGHWTRSVALPVEGTNVVTVVATDASGLSSSVVRTIIRDTQAPMVVVTTPTANAYSADTAFTVSGTATDANLTTVTVNGVVVTPDSAGHWSRVIGLPVEGSNPVTVIATDAAGHATTVNRAVTRDTQAPVLAVNSPQPTAYSHDTTITVSGTASDANLASVTINGIVATVDSTGHWSRIVSLGIEGANPITVIATDAAGLSTTVSRTVIRDTQAPALAVVAPQNGTLTQAPVVTVTGSVSDPNAVTLTVNGVAVAVAGDGSWILLLPLSEGLNPITVVATDAAGNATTATRLVTRDTQAPVIVIQTPDDGDVTTDSSVTVSGTVTDASGLTVSVNGVGVALVSGHFSTITPLIIGSNILTVTATDSAGNSATATRTVTRNPAGPQLPPDPSTVAPALDPSVPTTTYYSTQFLYTGANPIQTGVFPGTITLTRAAVVRGAVKTRGGTILSGVTVSVRNHPEYGQTLSRADGAYDLAANGGAALQIDFTKAGYLPVQRMVTPQWQEWTVIDTVSMVPVDTAVTHISFAQPIEIARGSVSSDKDGTRQPTLMFKQGTVATMVMPDGSTQPLSAGDVRVTEYTVGPDGRSAMPGPLGAGTAYTYAAELSFDQAIAAGATSVTFSQPVDFYLDNFLNLPVGAIVPVGTYDHAGGKWIPEKDGRVIKLLSVTGGVADIAVDASLQAAPVAVLDSLGINVAERTSLAALYPVGKTLWWSKHSHFSSADWNVSYGIAGFNLNPFFDFLRKVNDAIHCAICGGSAISVENQTLGEDLPIAGTAYALHYDSRRSPGFAGDRTITIPAVTQVDTALYKAGRMQARNEAPSSVRYIIYWMTVAGQQLKAGPYPTNNTPAVTFTWNGKDAAGRPVVGKQRATISIQYWYPAAALAGSAVGASQGSSFGGPPPANAIGFNYNRDNPEIARVELFSVDLGSSDARGEGFGGWTLNVHHLYNRATSELTLGDGTTRTASGIGARVRNIMPTLGSHNQMITTPEGKIIMASAFNFKSGVWQYDPVTKTRVRLAGDTTIAYGFSGDGGLATSAKMNWPTGVALGPDGTLFIADNGNHRIRAVTPDGIIHTIAGTGSSTFSGDGGPALTAGLDNVGQIALGADGSLYTNEYGANRIRRIAPNGIITTLVGGGTQFFPADGTRGTDAKVDLSFQRMVMAPNGELYFVDNVFINGVNNAAEHVIYRVTPDGKLYRFAGHRAVESQTTLTPARKLTLSLTELNVDPQGRLLVTSAATVYRITPDGNVETIGGIGRGRCYSATLPCDPLVEPTDGAALQVPFEANDMLVTGSPDGRVFVYDGQIRSIEPALPNLGASELLVASEDGGRLYRFDVNGRHLQTLDALTHDTLVEFGYDSAGLVTSVKDANGFVTTFERTGERLSAITAPFGQRTVVDQDVNGYLNSLTSPDGQHVTLTTGASGLVRAITDARGGVHSFGFDGLGRLVADSSPSGLIQKLTKTETDTSTFIRLANNQGPAVSIRVDQLTAHRRKTTTTSPAGLVTVATQFENDSTVTLMPDGTVATTVTGSDPRFGPQVSTLKRSVLTLPSGLSMVTTASRTAAMTNPLDPFTVTSLIDSVTVNGRTSRSQYTKSTRTAVSTSPLGRTATAIFDVSGRLVQSTIPGLLSSFFQYDANGRLQQSHTGGRSATYSYDAKGRLVRTLDNLGRSDSLFYDANDRLTQRRLADGRVVAYGYDSLGHLTSITPSGRPAHVVRYDALGRLVEAIEPQVGSQSNRTTYDFNSKGRLTAIHRPDSLTVGFTADSAGRPTAVTFDRGQVSFTYHPTTGNLTSLTAPGGNGLAFAYDGSLPTSVTWSGTISGSTGVTYNNNLQVTARAVNGATVANYGYDLDGLLTQSGGLGLRRDAQNGRLLADSAGVERTDYGYDAYGSANAVTHRVGTDTALGFTYERDSVGRIVHQVERSFGVTHDIRYAYDSAGHLGTVTRDGVITAAYSYDANGNRLARSGPGGSFAGTYDAQDRVMTYGGASYAYGAYGDLQLKAAGTDSTRYSYDALGNLVRVVLPNGTDISYVIDGENRRIGKKVNGTLVQGWLYQDQVRPVAELDGSGNIVTRFVYATGLNVPDLMLKGDSTYRLIRDHLGSVRLVVNIQSGAVAQRIGYDEFGIETENTNPGFQPFGFAGGMVDEQTGLVRFGARDYDAVTGRWTTKDPLGFGAGSGNLYAYVGSNPVELVDPLGLSPCSYAAGWTECLAQGLANFGARHGGVGGWLALNGGALLNAGLEASGINGLAVAGDKIGNGDVCNGLLDAGLIIGGYAFGGVGGGVEGAEVSAATEAAGAAERGGAAPVLAGQAGEDAVRSMYDIGAAEKTAIEVNGNVRIPDGLIPGEVLSEVKNVGSLSYTSQLRDFAQYAADAQIRFDLYVRPSTSLSGPLGEAIAGGWINLRYIPGAP